MVGIRNVKVTVLVKCLRLLNPQNINQARCSLALLAFSLHLGLTAQTDYYVSTSGDNGNLGTTIGQAWQTIQYAMNNATPNSIVNIAAGTYNEKVEVNVSGTAGNQIIFKNMNQDEVIIDGTGLSDLEAIVGIFDQSYITIQGLKIQNSIQLDAQGIIVEGVCQGIEIRNNEISNIHFSSNPNAAVDETTNAQPIIVYGTSGATAIGGLIIDGNIVQDSRTGFSEGLAVNGNVDGFSVTSNTVHDITNIGIDMIGHEQTAPANDQARNGIISDNVVFNCISPYATAAGIYVDGGRDLVIERNRVYECQWGIEIGCENLNKTTSSIIVRNNMIYDNDDAGLAMGGYDFPSNSGKVIDCQFLNNTCYGNDKLATGIGGVSGEISLTYSENCLFENNIFYGNNPSGLMLFLDNVGSVGLALNYNLFYSAGDYEYDYSGNNYNNFDAYQTGSGQDAQSTEGDPSFIDLANRDLHLSVNSPAIDKGNPNFMSAANETDFDGDARLMDGRVDIGADESDLTLPVEYLAPFRGHLVNGLVELNWQIGDIYRASHFEIQKSSNGTVWLALEEINIEGGNRSFKIFDDKPFSPTSYYRLRQVDFDGSFTLQPTIVIAVDGRTQQAYPNPTCGKFNLPLGQQVEVMRIYDARGVLILEKNNPDSQQNLELSKGAYFLQLVTRTRTTGQSLIAY